MDILHEITKAVAASPAGQNVSETLVAQDRRWVQ
jgi:hypothetical protein